MILVSLTGYAIRLKVGAEVGRNLFCVEFSVEHNLAIGPQYLPY